MSNILIIKHGSLGDLIQACGAIEDIKLSHKQHKILLLTSKPYLNFMYECPYVDGVLIDQRLPRWNIFYLAKLKRLLTRYNFEKVYDLQNSSRTRFYRKFLLTKPEWCSTDTTLEPGQSKKDFDRSPVLERMVAQLKKGGISIVNTFNPNLKWATSDISKIINKFFNGKYFLIFPFCSEKHPQKKWPYYKELIEELRRHFTEYNIAIAPGPKEIDLATEFGVYILLKDRIPLNIKELLSVIDRADFVIANDTGPAHIANHLNKNGLALFGSHTSPEKVSIGNSNFKYLKVDQLADLKVEDVINKVKELVK